MTSAVPTHSVMTPEEVADAPLPAFGGGSAITPGHVSTHDEAERVDASTARHEGRKRVLGTIAGHECVVSVMGDTVYDRDGHGTWYLCGYVSDADALSRWRGWLRSQGEDA